MKNEIKTKINVREKVPVVAFVVPCYNEQECIKKTAKEIRKKMSELIIGGEMDPKSFMLFVDDGSTDATWRLITIEADEYKDSHGIRLAHNRGHQKALMTGLMECANNPDYYCDCCISLDADLQDDINAVTEMITKYNDGAYDVVYGIRSDRSTDSKFKKNTAEMFYKFIEACGVETVFNHADYRLLSRKALLALSEYKERNIYIRGMIPDLGLSESEVFYERKPRSAGESHYPLSKMLSLAIDGVTSFSVKPLTTIAILGGAMCGVSVFLILLFIIASLCGADMTVGFLIAFMTFLNGLTIGCVGGVGIYVGRAYIETKQRPISYLVEKI